MVIDKIKNASSYYGLSPFFETALKYLSETDFSKMEAGKYDVLGDNVFVFVQKYSTLPISECKAEGHKDYADIQFVFSGSEQIGYESIDNAVPTGESIPEVDLFFYEPVKNYAPLQKGTFAIMWPQDIHTPKCQLDQPADIIKIVAKVRV